jgi:excisionase family DNA binding protein
MKKPKPSPEEWLSLEEAAEVLGVPWVTVWRWARDGDSRLPAYKTWAAGPRDQVSYRFRKEDVLALREPPQSQDVFPASPDTPPLDGSGSQCQATGFTVNATLSREAEGEDQAPASDLAPGAQETPGTVTP